MMCIHMTFSKKNHSTPLHSTPLHSTHSTELFKIFFSLLTLSTAFLQKASGPGKNSTREGQVSLVSTHDVTNPPVHYCNWSLVYFVSKMLKILTNKL